MKKQSFQKSNKPTIVIVLGPTATGKSDLAVQIAKQFNGEIISADSRQVYLGMDLGSGKITKREMKNVPHHLLGVVKPTNKFSVARWQKLTEQAIKKILSHGKLPIICGGTGFYIDSIIYNHHFPTVKPDQKLRAQLSKKNAKELFIVLQKLDKNFADKMNLSDQQNPPRLIRAIEIATQLGKIPLPTTTLNPNYNFIFIGLDDDDQNLKNRINQRLSKRIRLGMVAEIRRLRLIKVSWQRLESFGLEYREVAKFLQNKISRDEMVKNLQNDIWHFVKRQRTWFKRYKNIHWFKPQQDQLVLNFLKAQYDPKTSLFRESEQYELTRQR